MTSYFSGQGKVYVSPRDGSGNPINFTYLGNCASLLLSVGTGGEYEASFGSAADLPAIAQGGDLPVITMTLDEFNRDNLAKALYGQGNTTAGAPVASEVIVAKLGFGVPLANINLSVFTSLKNATDTVTYVNGTDYTVDLPSGLLTFPATGSAIVDGQTLHANYTFGAYDKVGVFTTAQPFWYFRFNGINTMSGLPCVLDAYKVRMLPVSGYPLISDDFAAMQWNALVQWDDLRTNTQADGNLFRIRQA